jgi:hypothetical protein
VWSLFHSFLSTTQPIRIEVPIMASTALAERLATMTRQEKIEQLERKRDLLKECNENIERLKAQLEVAKVRKQEKDQKDAVARAPHSNRGLPDDLLLPIFQYYVMENSMGIRRLVRVCRGWRDLILLTTDHGLWSTIRVEIPPLAKDINACVKFCEECVKRSGEKLLDIYLDYTTAALPFERVLFEHLLEPLQQVNDDPEYREMLDTWLMRRCRMENKEFFIKYQEHFMKPLNVLGKAEVMGRWRSFELHCQQTTKGLFNLGLVGPVLHRPAEKLESIKIINTGRFPTVWAKAIDKEVPFTKLPSLRRLSLTYCHIPLEDIEFNPERMETLELPWYSEAQTLSKMVRCRNVISLSFNCSHVPHEEDLEKYVTMGPGEHEFPYLQRMKVGGRVEPIFWTACSFPVLEEITFVDGRGAPSLVRVDQFTFPQVHTITFLGPPVNKAEEVPITDLFKKIVLGFPALRTINALEKYSEPMMQSLNDLKASGVTSSSLTKLVLKAKRTDALPSRSVDLAPITHS